MSESESSDSYDQELIGEVLNKKYLIITPIGSGTFATVWLAMTLDTQKFYAIKIQNWEDYDEGIDEAEILTKLKKCNSNYINTIIDYFNYEVEDGICVCMVFELMVGSVYDIMKCEKYANGLPLNIVKSVIFQLLHAMKLINNRYNIIHTDIKPENLLIVGKNNKHNEICQRVKNNVGLMNIIKKNKQNHKQIKDIVCNIDFTEITEKYYTNNLFEFDKDIIIKLSDFGTYKDIDHQDFDIQTRYYRAPEIILGYPYNSSCDLWSVGCLIYELLSGHTLFDPDKSKRISRDRYHIHNMICILGKIPQYLIDKSKQKSLFFTHNNLLKGIDNINYISLDNLINKTLSMKLDTQQLALTTNLMQEMLQYDPFKRPTIDDLLKHEWFVC